MKRKFYTVEEKLAYECDILIKVLGILVIANFLVSVIALILER